MNQVREVLRADLRIVKGRIESIAQRLRPRQKDTILDAGGLTIFPGFIQLHVRLCHSIFRHMADDLEAGPELRRRILPLEAAHNPASLNIATRVGIAELLLSGTTTAFSVETTLGSEHVFEVIADSGLRCVSGKALMDAGRGLPKKLKERTSTALAHLERHLSNWNGKGRLEVAVCPRFAPFCSPDLLRGAAKLAEDSGAWIHTQVAETREEVQQAREAFGRNPLLLFDALGMLDGRFIAAHAVHLNEAEKLLLAGRRHALIAHCPTSNMKLSSGTAPLMDLLSRGIHVGLGTDSCAFSNSLDLIREMRQAALLQKASRGAGILSAEHMVELCTIAAARAIGREEDLGSIEPGKLADLAFFDLNRMDLRPAGSPAQQLVWSSSARDLVHTMVEGRFLVRNRSLRLWKEQELTATARRETNRLLQRAGLEGKVPIA